jgi:hypothetical protein
MNYFICLINLKNEQHKTAVTWYLSFSNNVVKKKIIKKDR